MFSCLEVFLVFGWLFVLLLGGLVYFLSRPFVLF